MNKTIQQGAAVVAERGASIGVRLVLVQVGGLQDIQPLIVNKFVCTMYNNNECINNQGLPATSHYIDVNKRRYWVPADNPQIL